MLRHVNWKSNIIINPMQMRVFTILLALMSTFTQALSVNDVRGENGHYLIDDLYFFLDHEKAFQIEDVVNIDDAEFSRVSMYKLPEDHTPTWLYFDINNHSSTPAEIILSFEHLRINRVSVYDRDNISAPLYDTGLDKPVATRR